ncbi:hypothetical protein P9112_013138 [Eukaryota sp. TZLM1-RC]
MATFSAAPYIITPSGDSPKNVKVLQICQKTRLALNLFDNTITAFRSKIRQFSNLQFWKPVLRSVEGRYIYTSSNPPSEPFSYLELSLLPSHLTPAVLRSTSSNPSASFFLILHPFGISPPLPLSDTGSLKRALDHLDDCLCPLYFQTPRPSTARTTSSAMVCPSCNSPSFGHSNFTPRVATNPSPSPNFLQTPKSPFTPFTTINSSFPTPIPNDFKDVSSSVLNVINNLFSLFESESTVCCKESFHDYNTITVPYLTSSSLLKRPATWIDDLIDCLSRGSISIDGERTINLISDSDEYLTLSCTNQSKLTSPSLTRNDQSKNQSNKIEVVTLSKRHDLLSIRDVSSSRDVTHLLTLMETSSQSLSTIVSVDDSNVVSFLEYHPNYWQLYSKALVKTKSVADKIDGRFSNSISKTTLKNNLTICPTFYLHYSFELSISSKDPLSRLLPKIETVRKRPVSGRASISLRPSSAMFYRSESRALGLTSRDFFRNRPFSAR